MLSPRNLSLGRKQMLVIMLTSSVVLFLAAAAFVAYDAVTFRRQLVESVSVLANAIGNNCAAAIDFNDPKAATETLAGLHANENIVSACVYSRDGRVFANYQRDHAALFVPPLRRDLGQHFRGDQLHVFRPVAQRGVVVGVIFVASDLKEISSRLLRYIGLAGLVLLASLLVALGLSSQLQRLVSDPILHLARLARSVAMDKDYAVRATKQSNDELGQLVDGFNEMLAQIQARDAALQTARDSLEERVGERTKELQQEISMRALTEEALRQSEGLAKSILNSLAANIAVLDEAGQITANNNAWEKFAQESGEDMLAGTRPRVNYLDVLRQNPGEEAQKALKGIASVLNKAMVEFTLEYPCHSAQEQRWFMLYATPLFKTQGGAVIAHINITERKRAEAELETMHKKLVDTSRAAGMAEVATGVLHNVGNVLNSVNVSVTLVSDNMKKSKVVNLGKVAALIEENSGGLGAYLTNDPKGKQLPAYLSQLAAHLAKEQQSALAELDTLRKNIEHIKDIVAMQQSYARVSGVMETIKVRDLVDDALNLNAGALTRHQVQVIREYAEMPSISTDKHKVLQILVNLVRNAKYACDESENTDKRLTVRLTNGNGSIKIMVMDNGVGIPQENLTRIFNHGFTTRKDGHGFGLHSGALAARELGGALVVHSAGVGQGATFTLELPVDPQGRGGP